MYHTECTIEGCKSYLSSREYCSKHYYRWKKHGDPLKVMRIVGESRKKNPVYDVYYAMLARCNSPTNPSYKYYGERGIKVCDEWQGFNGFAQFIQDMGERPNGLTLERRDNMQGYSPKNCYWADRHQQGLNRRVQSNNNSGIVGVSLHKATGRWAAHIYNNGKKKHLGYFSTKEEASEARTKAIN